MSTSKFNDQDAIDKYLSSEKIQCLECKKWFRSLGSHLTRVHGMTCNDYRDKYELPRKTPLSGLSTRQMLSNQMVAMRQEGVITNDHLAEAAKKIDYENRAPKKNISDDKQRKAASAARFNKNKLDSGSVSSIGRNMDRAREYQRALRALKKGDDALMIEYKTKYGTST